MDPSAPPSYGEATEKKYEGGYTPGGQPYPPNYPGSPLYPQYGAAPSAPPAAGYQQPVPQPTGYSQPTNYAYNSHPEVPVGYQPPPPQPQPYVSAVPPSAGHAEEAGFSVGRTFSDKDVRRTFIRKVFLILGLQLLVTFGIVCIFTLVDDVGVWVRSNSWVYWVSYAVFLTLYIVLVCVESVRRNHPMNLIMLALFTLALSYMTGTIAAFYSTRIVMIALGVTVLVCLAVILFSIQTKFDFTKCSGLLFVLVMVLMLFGFITIFTYRYYWYLQVVYGCLGALVFTLFLAFDTQMVMGGKKHELDPEEYVFGALTLYIDVVYIFLFILAIFGGSNN